jgi:hypothetical protein
VRGERVCECWQTAQLPWLLLLADWCGPQAAAAAVCVIPLPWLPVPLPPSMHMCFPLSLDRPPSLCASGVCFGPV